MLTCNTSPYFLKICFPLLIFKNSQQISVRIEITSNVYLVAWTCSCSCFPFLFATTVSGTAGSPLQSYIFIKRRVEWNIYLVNRCALTSVLAT